MPSGLHERAFQWIEESKLYKCQPSNNLKFARPFELLNLQISLVPQEQRCEDSQRPENERNHSIEIGLGGSSR